MSIARAPRAKPRKLAEKGVRFVTRPEGSLEEETPDVELCRKRPSRRRECRGKKAEIQRAGRTVLESGTSREKQDQAPKFSKIHAFRPGMLN